MDDDAIANAGARSGYDVDLNEAVVSMCFVVGILKVKLKGGTGGFTWPARSGVSLSGSKLSPRKKPEVTMVRMKI